MFLLNREKFVVTVVDKLFQELFRAQRQIMFSSVVRLLVNRFRVYLVILDHVEKLELVVLLLVVRVVVRVVLRVVNVVRPSQTQTLFIIVLNLCLTLDIHRELLTGIKDVFRPIWVLLVNGTLQVQNVVLLEFRAAALKVLRLQHIVR
jgi:hypothetical protein